MQISCAKCEEHIAFAQPNAKILCARKHAKIVRRPQCATSSSCRSFAGESRWSASSASRSSRRRWRCCGCPLAANKIPARRMGHHRRADSRPAHVGEHGFAILPQADCKKERQLAQAPARLRRSYLKAQGGMRMKVQKAVLKETGHIAIGSSDRGL